MAMTRTFTLKNSKGAEVDRLTTTFKGKRTTFEFPYTTKDQEEIDFLLAHRAVGKRPTPVRPPTPPVFTAPEPSDDSEGGVEKDEI